MKPSVSNDYAALARNLFKAIDSKDVDKFSSFLDDEVIFIFANADPVVGKADVEMMVDGFFHMISGISHNLFEVIVQANQLICIGEVTYTRLNRTILTVPFAVVMAVAENRIKRYQIFVDNSALNQPE
ncbi:Uncharacterised protein [BD1-7 clade bacterium]|uniref:SnoaL-like domain-containing protein n=1 Tax=BD1-7 clade bacterium TaxID=2029982 RepID=A0A5S9QSD6_9GAMM|nr:Uncharacterised protein [BD1-7 clade bacterium]